MTNLERRAELTRKAAVVQKIWLHDREERRAMLAKDNEAIKQRWIELDSVSTKALAAGQNCSDTEMASQCLSGGQNRKEKE